MAEERKTKLELVENINPLPKELIEEFGKVAKELSEYHKEIGKQSAAAFRKSFEDAGFHFREVEIVSEKKQEAPKETPLQQTEEKLRIKIIPAKYRHDVGEVGITISQKDIEVMGKLQAYIQTLKRFKERVEEVGFHNAVGANTDYNKINAAEGWLYNGFDEKEKSLKIWLIESLEEKIKSYESCLPCHEEKHEAPKVTENSPRYIQDLFEVGLIDGYFRCDSLDKVAVFIMQNKQKYSSNKSNFEITTTMLRQFKQLDGSEYSKPAISKAKKAAQEL